MAQQQNLTNEQQRQVAVERMWLHYYNNTLLEKGIITETQHRRMKAQINGRKRPVSERSER